MPGHASAPDVSLALDTTAEEMTNLEARMEALRAERAEIQRSLEPQIDTVSCVVSVDESAESVFSAAAKSALGKRAEPFLAISASLDGLVNGRAAHVSVTRHTLVDIDVKERLSLAIDFR